MDSNKLEVKRQNIILEVEESSGISRPVELTITGFIDITSYEFGGKVLQMNVVKDEEKNKIKEVIKILESLL